MARHIAGFALSRGSGQKAGITGYAARPIRMTLIFRVETRPLPRASAATPFPNDSVGSAGTLSVTKGTPICPLSSPSVESRWRNSLEHARVLATAPVVTDRHPSRPHRPGPKPSSAPFASPSGCLAAHASGAFLINHLSGFWGAVQDVASSRHRNSACSTRKEGTSASSCSP